MTSAKPPPWARLRVERLDARIRLGCGRTRGDPSAKSAAPTRRNARTRSLPDRARPGLLVHIIPTSRDGAATLRTQSDHRPRCGGSATRSSATNTAAVRSADLRAPARATCRDVDVTPRTLAAEPYAGHLARVAGLKRLRGSRCSSRLSPRRRTLTSRRSCLAPAQPGSGGSRASPGRGCPELRNGFRATG
jgi:hypothetical protein